MQHWVKESNTRWLESTSPYLNGKCSNASWPSGDQNSTRRRNTRQAESHSITATRLEEDAEKKREKLSREQQKKICEELRLLKGSEGWLKLHISLKVYQSGLTESFFQKLQMPIRRKEDDFQANGMTKASHRSRGLKNYPDVTSKFQTRRIYQSPVKSHRKWLLSLIFHQNVRRGDSWRLASYWPSCLCRGPPRWPVRTERCWRHRGWMRPRRDSGLLACERPAEGMQHKSLNVSGTNT